MTTVVLVPVLNRPHNVAPLVESFEAATDDARLLFVASEGDEAELAAIHDADAEVLIVEKRLSCDYPFKINQGAAATTEPFLFTGADDLHFHPGWLTAAMARMSDPGVGVVGTRDLCNVRTEDGTHSTHSLVRRRYIEDFGTADEQGKILHEGYWHEWCDDELVATAMFRGAWAFAPDSVVEHLHPRAGKAKIDDLYALARHRMVQGNRLFHERQHLWT